MGPEVNDQVNLQWSSILATSELKYRKNKPLILSFYYSGYLLDGKEILVKLKLLDG
jgi:hypothetical protein